MRFSGEMYDGVNLIFSKEPFDKTRVADISMNETITRIRFQIGQTAGIAGISQFIKVDQSHLM
jgi:hypothetical protein